MTLRLSILCLALTAITALASQQQDVLMRRAHGVRGPVVASYVVPDFVSMWPLAGNAHDVNGTNNGTLVYSPISTNGVKGLANTAYYFGNPASNYAICGTNYYPVSSTGFSATAWFKTTASVRQTVFTKFFYNATSEAGFYMDVLANGKPRCSMESSGMNYRVADGSSALNDGNWHHVCMVGSNSVSMYLYVDGSYVSVNSLSIGASVGSLDSGYRGFNIALDSDCGYEPGFSVNFNGFISLIRLYSRQLSASEISTIYNAEKP